MKIKMKVGIAGAFHNITGGVAVGDVVEVDDDNGARYCALGYAEPVAELKKAEEHAVAPKGEERQTPRKAPAKAAEKPHTK